MMRRAFFLCLLLFVPALVRSAYCGDSTRVSADEPALAVVNAAEALYNQGKFADAGRQIPSRAKG
jgi:hypothetical protein